MGMMQDLPLDVMCLILKKVAKSSCIDLASVSATSPELRGIVNETKCSMYEFMNILPLLDFARWSNSQLEFLQDCIDRGNTEAQFWFGLWCFRVLGDWNRARKYLGKAKENNHDMALYVWTMFSAAEELEEEDWAKIKEFYSRIPTSKPQHVFRALITETPVLSNEVADHGVYVVKMSCDNPWHFGWLGGPGCLKCMCGYDARCLWEILRTT